MTEHNYIPLKAKYRGKCIACLNAINVGDDILWSRGEGVKHQVCPSDDTNTLEIAQDLNKPFKNPTFFKYSELDKIKDCQCCGKQLQNDIYLQSNEQGYRKVCKECF